MYFHKHFTHQLHTFKSWVCCRARTECDAKIMFSTMSFVLFMGGGGCGGTQPKSAHAWQGEGGYSAKKWEKTPSKKVLMPRGEGGGVPIMHCCLHVISLLSCCHKKELLACTCLYIVKLQGILGNYPTPLGMSTLSPLDVGTTAVRSKQSRFELPSCL